MFWDIADWLFTFQVFFSKVLPGSLILIVGEG